MYAIHQSAMFLHIGVGSVALLLFWIPILGRKGGFNHRRFGRYFVWAMYTVATSGLIMSGLDLVQPLATHARGLTLSQEEAAAATAEVRHFALFLFSLSILVLTSTRQGSLVIRHKDQREALRSVPHTALCASLVLIGIVLLQQATVTGNVLFYIFGGLQVVSGIGSLRYNFKKEIHPKEWWIEHLSSLIGSGIGAYTAFFVFGGSQLFSSLFGEAFSSVSVFLWVFPGVIGGVAIRLFSKHYRKLFDPDWALRKAERRALLFR